MTGGCREAKSVGDCATREWIASCFKHGPTQRIFSIVMRGSWRVMTEHGPANAVLDAPGVEELAPDLHVMGGVVQSNQRVSWCANRPGQFQPINCYLLAAGDQRLLIDTGVAIHEATVLAGLESLLSAGSEISVYLTRAELECFSNLGAIA